MRYFALFAVLFAFADLAAQEPAAQSLRGALFAEADALLAEARAADAQLLAPTAFERAMARYRAAESDLERGRGVERIRTALAEAARQLRQSIEASAIAEITLASLIKTREDAASANAGTFAAALWQQAEAVFNEAARELESGDIRDARAAGERAEALYRDAELTAIKAQYLSQTRALLTEADQRRVPRYAPATYARARDLLEQAEAELEQNRYDTDLPRSLAQQANYEARHAIFLAEQIRRVDNRELSIEELILRYEEPLTQVAAAADMVAVLDQGAAALTADLTLFIEELRDRARQTELDLSDSRQRIAELEDEIRELDEQLGGVSQERVALVQRLEAEARIREQFASIETLFEREEARVSREGNTIVLRLVGLTFESGSREIDASNRALLEKVARAAQVFPRSELIIEGHTDSYGSDDANMSLSRERAAAVSDYLAGELGIPIFRISAVGYGETQPIANNETPQGRARNRRIDVRIQPQLE